MKDFYKKLNKELENTRLTPEERASMRARVLAHMKAHPAKAASPYFFYSFFTLRSFSGVGQFASASRYALASLLDVLLVGGSTVSAAQGALPGDVLYPIKININERAELALALTPEEEIQVEKRFASRRVAEAQALDAEGRLDVPMTEEIEKNFDRHAARALALASDAWPEMVALHTDEEDSEPPAEEGNTASGTIRALKMEQVAPEISTTSPASSEGGFDFKKKEEISSSLQKQREILQKIKERHGRRQGTVGEDVQEVNSYDSGNRDDEDGDDDNNEKDSF